MKICIIGNSHIGALRWAERDRLFAEPVPEIAFWGVPGAKFFEVKFENGRLIAPDPRFALHVSGGRYETIDPEEFDVLVFHGPPLNATVLLSSLRHLQAGHRDQQEDQADLRSYSAAFLRDGIAASIDKRPACGLIRRIRANFKGRILASPQPLISEQSNHFGKQRGRSGDWSLLNGILRECFASRGAEYVPQPANTLVKEQYTAAPYCTATTVKSRAGDYRHMNGLYGRRVWRAIAQELEASAEQNDRLTHRSCLATL